MSRFKQWLDRRKPVELSGRFEGPRTFRWGWAEGAGWQPQPGRVWVVKRSFWTRWGANRWYRESVRLVAGIWDSSDVASLDKRFGPWVTK
jgi:hypothetical protein